MHFASIPRARLLASVACLLAALLVAAPSTAQPANRARGEAARVESGAQVYARACAACHGDDGRGRERSEVGFSTPLPDFTDCDYASRERQADWFAIVHEGGPVRSFNRMMPAFRDALDDEEISKAVDYVRSLCTDKRWPRGEDLEHRRP
jgi:mono/diheme cytochrome c family protein